jgi:hypothetical protein
MAAIDMTTIPDDADVESLQTQTGMDRMQAIYHLRARRDLLCHQRLPERPPDAATSVLSVVRRR